MKRGYALAVVIITVVLFAGAGAWYLSQAPVRELPKYATVQEKTQAVPQEPVPKEKTTLPVAESAPAAQPRIISCNPRTYDPGYFARERPCVSDMTAIDIERENKALDILEKAAAADPNRLSAYRMLPQLYVSAERYQLITVNLAPEIGFIIVDIDGGVVTEFIQPLRELKASSKVLLFVSSDIRSYSLGSSGTKLIAGTKLVSPQTYCASTGLGGCRVPVLASTSNSLTLGIYDFSQASGPEEDYGQVASRQIVF